MVALGQTRRRRRCSLLGLRLDDLGNDGDGGGRMRVDRHREAQSRRRGRQRRQFVRGKRRARDDQRRNRVRCDQDQMIARIRHSFIEQGRNRKAHHSPGFVEVVRRIPAGHGKDAVRRQMIKEGAPSLDSVKAVLG